MNSIKKLFLPDYMLKPEQRLDDNYSAKDFYSTFIKIAWPTILEAVLNGLVNFVDSVMVGSIGHEAVAAVGITQQPRLIFFAILFSLNIGVTAVVSRRKGENKQDLANSTMIQSLSVGLIIGILVAIIGIVFAEPLLRLGGAEDDIIKDSVQYFRITMFGMIFMSINGVICASQRRVGNTRIAFTSNMIANIVNVVFNAILINGLLLFPTLKVTGAAIATLISNIVAAAIALGVVLKKNGYLYLNFKEMFKFSREDLIPVFNVSSSALLEQLFVRIGFFTIAKLVAGLGTVDFSTHTICMSVTNLTFCIGDGLGNASAALVGQSLGRKRADCAILYGKIGQRVGILLSSLTVILLSLGGNPIMRLFTTDEPEADLIIKKGVLLLLLLAIASPGQISQVIYAGCLRGAGDTKFVALVGLICIGIERSVLTYLFIYPFGFGVTGAWLALCIDQYLRFILYNIRFSRGKWLTIRL